MDLYEDLDNYNEENNIEALQNENQELKNSLEKLKDNMQALQMEILQEYDNLAAEHKKLLSNFSSLLKTAKAEIQRKTLTIMQINTEKDQMILRLVNGGNARGVNQLRRNNTINTGIKSSDCTDSVNAPKDDKTRLSTNEIPKLPDNERIYPFDLPKIPKKNDLLPPKRECDSRDPRTNPDLREKENHSDKTPLRLSSRRKSMPAIRPVKSDFEEEEDCEIYNESDKHRINSEKPKSIVQSRSVERLRNPIERESRWNKEYAKEKQREKYEDQMREREIQLGRPRCRDREKELADFKKRAYKRSHSRHRLESPPCERNNRTKSDRRSDFSSHEENESQMYLERPLERRLTNRTYSSERRQSPGDRPPQRKDRPEKHQLLDKLRMHRRPQSPERRFAEKDRGGPEKRDRSQGKDPALEKRPSQEKKMSQERRFRSPHHQSAEKPSTQEPHNKHIQHDEERELKAKRRKLDSVSDILNRWGRSNDSPLPFNAFNFSTSCQSPDENLVERPTSSHNIKEIKLISQTQLDDPRYKSSKYIKAQDRRNKTVLTSVTGRDVEIKELNWNQAKNQSKKVKEIPKELMEPPKNNWIDLSEHVRDIYKDLDENHFEVSVDTDCVDEDKIMEPETNQITNEFKSHGSDHPKTNKDLEQPMKKNKIPKKISNNDIKTKGRSPIDLLNKNYIAEESANREQHKKSLCANSKEPKHKKESSNSEALREMVEGDLALSDDDNSIGKMNNDLTNNSSKTNYKVIELEVKTSKEQGHKGKINMNVKETATKVEIKNVDKCKKIKSKFSDLFGDSSLITPEDLNLPSEPVDAENNIMALSENANLESDIAAWSFADECNDKAEHIKTPIISKIEADNQHDCKTIKKVQIFSPESDLNEPKPEISVSKENTEKYARMETEHYDESNKYGNTLSLIRDNEISNEKDVVTVIVPGVQTQSSIEPRKTETPKINIETTLATIDTQALATSTPLRIADCTKTEPDKSETNCISDFLRKTKDDSASLSPNMTNSFTESEPHTPDVKIVLKRKRRVIKNQ